MFELPSFYPVWSSKKEHPNWTELYLLIQIVQVYNILEAKKVECHIQDVEQTKPKLIMYEPQTYRYQIPISQMPTPDPW